jgi:predicted dehydrogenase
MIRFAVVGGGNITNSRHIPALRKMKLEILGVISNSSTAVSKTLKNLTHKNLFCWMKTLKLPINLSLPLG